MVDQEVSKINELTSAQINPFSKSVWIAPAAWGAFVRRLICQHLTWKKQIIATKVTNGKAPKAVP